MNQGHHQTFSHSEKRLSESVKKARWIFLVPLGFNVVLSIIKLFWGYHSHTMSISADGFHSLLDAVANLVGIITLGFSGKPADHNHPYGHQKFEALAAMVISFFIFATCFGIAAEGFNRFFESTHSHPQITLISYIIVIFSLVASLIISFYENHQGQKLQSDLLKADAKHTLSDCVVSGSVLLSMVAVQMGLLWADTLLAFVVALIILKVGFDAISSNLSALTDEAVLDPWRVRDVVLSVDGVLDCHKIRSRGMPNYIFIDLHIQVHPDLSIKEAHRISYAVEDQLASAFEGRIAEVLVHVEEYEPHTD